MKKALILILLVVAGSYGKTLAQKAAVVVNDKTGWHKIGQTTVDFKKDKDQVLVMGADRFSALKFKVTDAPIDLIDLEVYYEGGGRDDIKVRTPLEPGQESRVIDLSGGERNLKKVVFTYKTLNNRKDEKAHVEIWGIKTNADKK